jgi:serine phosphatase RsbU (regulator of sigma subunit)
MKKNILLIIFTFLCLGFLSQKNNSDTSQMCIPYPVAKQILLDLNNYDKLQEVVKTYKEEIYELNKKTQVLQKENDSWEKEDSLNREIISEKNKAIEIIKEENKGLREENKRIKTKNTLYNIISAVIIAPLTYLALLK